ncbi:hypothetical protein GCM10020256_15600 [Streptomyces thermocoprophilus]
MPGVPVTTESSAATTWTTGRPGAVGPAERRGLLQAAAEGDHEVRLLPQAGGGLDGVQAGDAAVERVVLVEGATAGGGGEQGGAQQAGEAFDGPVVVAVPGSPADEQQWAAGGGDQPRRLLQRVGVGGEPVGGGGAPGRCDGDRQLGDVVGDLQVDGGRVCR